jgi:hypothetical protein
LPTNTTIATRRKSQPSERHNGINDAKTINPQGNSCKALLERLGPYSVAKGKDMFSEWEWEPASPTVINDKYPGNEGQCLCCVDIKYHYHIRLKRDHSKAARIGSVCIRRFMPPDVVLALKDHEYFIKNGVQKRYCPVCSKGLTKKHGACHVKCEGLYKTMIRDNTAREWCSKSPFRVIVEACYSKYRNVRMIKKYNPNHDKIVRLSRNLKKMGSFPISGNDLVIYMKLSTNRRFKPRRMYGVDLQFRRGSKPSIIASKIVSF